MPRGGGKMTDKGGNMGKVQKTPSSAEAMVTVVRLCVGLEESVSFSIGNKQSINFVSDFHSPWQSSGTFQAAGIHFRVNLTKAANQVICTLLILTEEQKKAYVELESSKPQSSTRSALLKLSKEVATDVELCGLTLQSSSCKSVLFATSSPRFKPEPLKLPLFFPSGVFPVSSYSCNYSYDCQVRCTARLRSVPLSAPPAFLARLLGGLLSDVTLRVQQRELRAHRCVLAAVSDVFRAMLEDARFKESATGVVEIEDVRADVMEAAMRHCYGQELGDLDGGSLTDLLILAERYQMLELKAACEGRLAEDQSLDALELLALADTQRAESLKKAVMLRIVESPDRKSILSQASALKVMRSNPEALAELMMNMA